MPAPSYTSLSAGSRLPAIQILVIPGNPGAARYYVPFMLALWDIFKGSAEVSALSQMGHGYSAGTKVDFLESIAQRNKLRSKAAPIGVIFPVLSKI